VAEVIARGAVYDGSQALFDPRLLVMGIARVPAPGRGLCFLCFVPQAGDSGG
jgi:hypothetical protein